MYVRIYKLEPAVLVLFIYSSALYYMCGRACMYVCVCHSLFVQPA